MQEGQDKRGMAIGRDEIRGLLAKGLPEQTNFCDCGVYLIGYIEKFLRDPDAFVRKALSRELDTNNDFAGFDPSEKRRSIREDLIALELEQKETKRRKKKADRDAKLAADQQPEGAADKLQAASSTRRSPKSTTELACNAQTAAETISRLTEHADETDGPPDQITTVTGAMGDGFMRELKAAASVGT